MSAVVTTPSADALLDAPGARIGLRSLGRHTLTITRRNLLQVRNNPQLLVFIAIQPVLFVLLFVYVFGGAISGSSRDYVQFVIPGIITQTVVFGTVMTGIGLSEDLAKGIIDRFRSLPIARSAVLTGRILADSARTAAAILITTAVGMLLGFRLGGGPVAALGAFALAVGFGTAFAWIAATIGLTVRNPETAQSAGFLWMFPLTFASAAFAPAASMPGWLQPVVEANPITVLTEALRALTSGGPATGPVLQSIAWIGGLTLVFAPLAIRQYRRLA
jgi:ABC transporter DrrB family efflux protein